MPLQRVYRLMSGHLQLHVRTGCCCSSSPIATVPLPTLQLVAQTVERSLADGAFAPLLPRSLSRGCPRRGVVGFASINLLHFF